MVVVMLQMLGGERSAAAQRSVDRGNRRSEEQRLVGAGECSAAEFRDLGLLRCIYRPFAQEALQFGAMDLQCFTRSIKRCRGATCLIDDHIEDLGHCADFVCGVNGHMGRAHRRTGMFEIALCKCTHRPSEISKSAAYEQISGVGDARGAVGDHARQHEPDRDGENCDSHEDVLKHGGQRWILNLDGPDGQEIAQAMLRRQQAEAVIAARKMIVHGAVSMVQMALQELSDKNIVQLDEDRKAAMVSNLLVVLCGEAEVHPVINTGTLYN